jgi:lipid-binding SYLF domain-containing protein
MSKTPLVPLACIGLICAASAAPAEGLLDRARQGVSEAAGALDRAVDRQTAPTPAAELDAAADAALAQLREQSPEARELSEKAVAVLVFPKITKAGFMVGGQFGEGVMRRGEETIGYYNILGASYGLQIGGQQFSYAMFFLNDAAVRYFEDNEGWEAGAGPTLVGGREGWSASMGTNDLQGDIVPVFFGQAGLMAGGGLQGTKITRLER